MCTVRTATQTLAFRSGRGFSSLCGHCLHTWRGGLQSSGGCRRGEGSGASGAATAPHRLKPMLVLVAFPSVLRVPSNTRARIVEVDTHTLPRAG